jgi:hypothetical protein
MAVIAGLTGIVGGLKTEWLLALFLQLNARMQVVLQLNPEDAGRRVDIATRRHLLDTDSARPSLLRLVRRGSDKGFAE